MRWKDRCGMLGILVTLVLFLAYGCGGGSLKDEDGSVDPDGAPCDGALCEALSDAGSSDAGWLSLGEPCESSGECAQGHCVDGHCCEGDCAGECRSCGLPGSLGICVFHQDGTDPDEECGPCRMCDGQGGCEAVELGTDPKGSCIQEAPDTCGHYGGCDGAEQCLLWPAGTPCSEEVCQGSILQHAGECNGSGACQGGSATSCGAYGCNSEGTACLSSCTGPTDCAPGYICHGSGQCVPDSVGLVFVAIRGGLYDMGTEDWISSIPVHPVTVPGFELTMTEVTVAQFAACVAAGMCTLPATGGLCNWGLMGREDHPVNCVSWFQARSYCAWLGARLPSEAEWEYAARSQGQDILYPWGNEEVTCQRAVMYQGGAGCGAQSTMPVCSKPLGNTAQGICDMAGNVTEWTEDDWFGNYVGAPSDGSAWVANPRKDTRTVRGGNFDVSSSYMFLAAFRSSDGGIVQGPENGIRCAKTP